MARFALFTNGVKVETLDDLKENFNIKDMLENYRNKALHRWLVVNRMTSELSQIESISAQDDDTVINELARVLGVSTDVIKKQKLILEQEVKKQEDVLSELEKEQLTDIEIADFLKYMDETSDVQKAITILRKHAEKGNPVAQLKLGCCFENAKGVEENLELAAEWYKRSAEQGLARAQNLFGDCLNFGIGVEQNIDEALLWYRKAARQNDISAKCSLIRSGKIHFKESAELSSEITDFVKKGHGFSTNEEAEIWLGDLYWNDICSQKDHVIQDHLSKALYWYLLAIGNDKQIRNVEAAFKYLDVCIYLIFFADADECRLFRIREVIKVVIELCQREIDGAEAYFGILKSILNDDDVADSGVTLPDYCITFCNCELDEIVPTIIKDARAGILCAMCAIWLIHGMKTDEVDCYIDEKECFNLLKKAAKQKYQFAQKFLSKIEKA